MKVNRADIVEAELTLHTPASLALEKGSLSPIGDWMGLRVCRAVTGMSRISAHEENRTLLYCIQFLNEIFRLPKTMLNMNLVILLRIYLKLFKVHGSILFTGR
jgi:hypothetical protein